MPEDIINSLAEGFDPAATEKLMLDTQERWDTLSMPNNAPEFKMTQPAIPKSYGGDDLIFKQRNNVNFASFLDDPDPDKRNMAMNYYTQKALNSDAVKNHWSDTVYKYEPYMERYKEHGYNLSKSVEENEDHYHKLEWTDKPWYNNVGTTLATWAVKVPALAAIKLVNSVNTLVTMGENVGEIGNGKFWSSVAENGTVRWMEDLEKGFKDKFIPVYKSINYDQKGFWNKLTDFTFWNDSVADGVAFMASAMLPGTAIGKLGTLAKLSTNPGMWAKFLGAEARTLAAGAGKAENLFGKALQFTTGSRNVAGVIAHGINTTSESALEAVGAYKSIKQSLLDEGMSEENATKKAGEAASFTYNANMAVLSFSNAMQNKWMQKLIGKGPVSSMPVDIDNTLKAIGIKVNTPMGKFFTENFIGKRLGYYSPKILKSVANEGYWEENAQTGITRLAEQKYGKGYYVRSGDDGDNIKERVNLTGNVINDLASQWWKQTKDATIGNDREIAESIGVGGIIGIGGEVVSSIGERRKEEVGIAAKIKNLNDARENFLSNSDVFKKTGEIDLEKVAAKKEKIKELTERFNISDGIINPIIKKQIQKNIFSDYVLAHIKNNTAEQLVEKLSDYSNNTDKDLLSTYGFSEEMSGNPIEYAQWARDLIDINKSVNDINYSPKVNSKESISKSQFDLYEGILRSTLYDANSKNVLNTDTIDAITTDIEDTHYQTHRINNELNSIIKQREELEGQKDVDGTLQSQKDLLDSMIKDVFQQQNINLINQEKNSGKSIKDIFEDYKKKIIDLDNANTYRKILEAKINKLSDSKNAINDIHQDFLKTQEDEKLAKETEEKLKEEEIATTNAPIVLSEDELKKETEKKNELEKVAKEAAEKTKDVIKTEEEKNDKLPEEEKVLANIILSRITELKTIEDLNTYLTTLTPEELANINKNPAFIAKKEELTKLKEKEEQLIKLNQQPIIIVPPVIIPPVIIQETSTQDDENDIKIEESAEEQIISAIPFETALKTTTRFSYDAIKEDGNKDKYIEIIDTDRPYALFQNEAITMLTSEMLENTSAYIIKDDFKEHNVFDIKSEEEFNKVQGSIIVLRDKANTRNILVNELFGKGLIPDRYKPLANKPVVFSTNVNTLGESKFDNHKERSAVAFEQNGRGTYDEAMAKYAEEKKQLIAAKESAMKGKPVKIDIVRISPGFAGVKGDGATLAKDRFGGVNSVIVNDKGQLIGSTPKGEVRVFMPSLKDNKELFSKVTSVFNAEYTEKEEVEKAIKYLKQFIFTNKKSKMKFTIGVTNSSIDTSGKEVAGKFVIHWVGYNEAIKLNVKQDDIITKGNIKINFSRDAYKNGYKDADGTAISAEAYQKMVNSNVTSNRKIFLNKDGTQFKDVVHRYFDFTIDAIPKADIVKDNNTYDLDTKRKEVKQALQKAGQGEGGVFFITLVDGSKHSAVRISLVGNELGYGNNGETADLSIINKIENPNGTIVYNSEIKNNNTQEDYNNGLLEAKKADIEKRRELVLSKVHKISGHGVQGIKWFSYELTAEGKWKKDYQFSSRTEEETIKLINAKYDKELSDLIAEDFNNTFSEEIEKSKQETIQLEQATVVETHIVTQEQIELDEFTHEVIPSVIPVKEVTVIKSINLDFSERLSVELNGEVWKFNRQDGELVKIDDSRELSETPNANQPVLDALYENYPFDKKNPTSTIFKMKSGDFLIYILPTAKDVKNTFVFDTLNGTPEIVVEGIDGIKEYLNEVEIEEIKQRYCKI